PWWPNLGLGNRRRVVLDVPCPRRGDCHRVGAQNGSQREENHRQPRVCGERLNDGHAEEAFTLVQMRRGRFDTRRRWVEQEVLLIPVRGTGRGKLGQLILSVRSGGYDQALVVIGRAGLPNVVRALKLGDAVLFETPDAGLLEVRLVGTSYSEAKVL